MSFSERTNMEAATVTLQASNCEIGLVTYVVSHTWFVM